MLLPILASQFKEVLYYELSVLYIWAAFQSIIMVTYINLACGRINSDFNTFKTLSILIYVEINFTKKKS